MNLHCQLVYLLFQLDDPPFVDFLRFGLELELLQLKFPALFLDHDGVQAIALCEHVVLNSLLLSGVLLHGLLQFLVLQHPVRVVSDPLLDAIYVDAFLVVLLLPLDLLPEALFVHLSLDAS